METSLKMSKIDLSKIPSVDVLLHTQEAQGIVIGLSGGIDSAVLVTLATRAVGKERVYARYLLT